MSNRRKTAGTYSVRQAVLHVLDVEYGRSSRAKDLARMEEITDIVADLKKLWRETAAEAQPVVSEDIATSPTIHDEPLPMPAFAPVQHVEEWTPPPPPEPPAPDLPPVGGYQLKDLLESVPEGLWGEDERRADAKGRLQAAVLRVMHDVLAMQMRYELALQAHNRNVRAIELFEPEANILGIGVADLASRIITERRTGERRMAHVYTILARASAEIDQAAEHDIEALAAAGIREIQALED